MTDFSKGRADGRSNQQVIIDMVRTNDEPGKTFTYEQLLSALNADARREFHTGDISTIVSTARNRLLRELQRALVNVRGVGYRIAFAVDHRSLALVREGKATKQFKQALDLLKHVRMDEMEENARRAHEAMLMIASILYGQQQALMRRQSANEKAIMAVMKRVEQLENEKSSARSE